MTTEAMVERMMSRLNREAEDDLFEYPREYYLALTDAHRYIYKKIAALRPEMLEETTTITSTDGGDTFVIPNEHYGEFKLYRSPGPPTGLPLVPSLPGGRGHFWLEGLTINMNVAYSGTLYITYMPALTEADDLDEDTDSKLPSYTDEALIWWACALLAKKPGFLGDPGVFEAEFDREWRGRQGDPSDGGVVQIIMRQSAYQSWEGNDEAFDNPWWRGIGGGTP